MKKVFLFVMSMFLLSGNVMAQEQKTDGQERPEFKGKHPKKDRMTQEQMTQKMVGELKLDEKQAEKVTKLNKKYKTLIEGEKMPEFNGQRPPMGQGRPEGRPGGGFGGGMPGGMPPHGMHGGPRGGMPPGGFPSGDKQSSYDYDKEQQKYDKQLRKLLSDEQYEGYLKLKPQFHSQRMNREFLFGGSGPIPELPEAPEADKK